ncbi:MAG: Pentachlorophenol 4-monooxygenase [Chlamydiae bacterium]|nr:Pentachlorophenol 4-monooxygenase [Chlamydiota bacterium]
MDPVVIVGAGPTGLVLAIECVRRGLPIRLIDEKRGPSTHSKALAIHARSLELLEKTGVVSSFLEEGIRVEEIVLDCKGNEESLSFKKLDSPFPFVLFLPQSRTEELLLSYLQELGGEVEWEKSLLDIIDGKALVSTPSGEKKVLEASWIAGCDGGGSRVREAAKIPVKKSRYTQSFLLIDAVVDKGGDFDAPHLFFGSKGMGLTFPIDQEKLRLVFPQPQTSAEALTNEEIETLLQARGYPKKIQIKEVLWHSYFHHKRMLATTFQKENIFLLGDAAHLHSPLGGQGMNTSIQDAWNLAWKLALVAKGASPPTLLESYTEERLPIALALLKKTSLLTRVIFSLQKIAPSLLFRSLAFFLHSKKRRKKLTHVVSELAIHYPDSSITSEPKRNEDWNGPKPGERAPDVVLDNGKHFFSESITPKHLLLLFSDKHDFIKAIEEEYGEVMEVKVFQDQNFREKYAAGPDSLFLIRPDGYIGYRSQKVKIEEVISYLLKIFTPISQRRKS